MDLAAFRQRHPGSSTTQILWYGLCRRLFAFILVIFWRARWSGTHHVPDTGALLIVANHQGYFDPPLVGAACSRRDLDFIARGGLFENPHFAGIIHSLNAIPIKENGGDTAAMKDVLKRLAQGKAVLIFPEGSRTLDGSMLDFKRGVAVLVKRANCPVLPIGIDGGHKAWPRGCRFPRPFRKIVAVIGRPIDHDDLMQGGPDAAIARLTSEVAKLVAQARKIRSG